MNHTPYIKAILNCITTKDEEKQHHQENFNYKNFLSELVTSNRKEPVIGIKFVNNDHNNIDIHEDSSYSRNQQITTENMLSNK